MAKKLRQLIFIIVLIASLLGMAMILLYSAGYRVNLLEGSIEETGAVRIVAQDVDDLELWLYPSGNYQAGTVANFTHLDPGAYTMVAKAPGYQDITLKLQVTARQTTVLDPLRLWSAAEPTPAPNVATSPIAENGIKTLPIPLQQAISAIPSNDLHQVLAINTDEAVIVQRSKGQVNLVHRSGHEATIRLIAEQMNAVELNRSNQLLLRGLYQLGLYNLSDQNFTTLLRITTPIAAATWYNNTPYILYSQGEQLHVIDTRAVTQYADQVIATLPTAITNLSVGEDGTVAIETGETNYYYAPRAK